MRLVRLFDRLATENQHRLGLKSISGQRTTSSFSISSEFPLRKADLFRATNVLKASLPYRMNRSGKVISGESCCIRCVLAGVTFLTKIVTLSKNEYSVGRLERIRKDRLNTRSERRALQRLSSVGLPCTNATSQQKFSSSFQNYEKSQ